MPDKIETMLYSELHDGAEKVICSLFGGTKTGYIEAFKNRNLQRNRIRILAGLNKTSTTMLSSSLFVEGYTGSSAKFEQLMEVLEECRVSGRRVLVFSQFTQMLGIIRGQLVRKGTPYFYLDGQTPPSDTGRVMRSL